MDRMKKVATDFKGFAFKGNIIDLAVGVMIGGAFNGVVQSLVGDLFMPLIGLFTKGENFTGLFFALDGKQYPSLAAAQQSGAPTLNYGAFIQSVFSFLVLALCVFILVKLLSKTRKPAPAPRLCQYCKMSIHKEATRCPHCTAQLEEN